MPSGISFPCNTRQKANSAREAFGHVLVKYVNSSGGPAIVESGVLGGMVGPERLLRERLLRASPARTGLEPAFAGTGRYELRGGHPDSTGLGTGESVDLLDDSPTLRLENLDLSEDQLLAPESHTTVPASKRFATWSRWYLLLVAAADALVGGISAAVPASISNTLSGYNAVPLLFLVGLVIWPAAIAICRGYRRNRIGVGFDEPGAVMRAGMVVIVAGALPAGLMAVPTGTLDPTGALTLYALLKLVVTGTPFAVLLSLLVRFFARRILHLLQRHGRSLRHVLVVGSFGAAQQLSERIQREPDAGMKVVGLCLPSAELPRPVVDGIPVLGSLHQVSEVVRTMGCDAVAVTSDDATRYNYLRALAWSLEGADVELLVDPGLVEVAGPRMHIRPLLGFPLLHVEEPHFTGWRWVVKRMSDLVLTSVGLLIISPLLVVIAAVVKLQDGGPVIFRQARIGRDGRPFTMLKFRSMVVDAEDRKLELMQHNEGNGGLFKLSADPRVTRFGRFLRSFSLDELPQLFNVLTGSMSLVGPRPHLASELAQMPSEASRRSLVTPGLTGLWQVSGRSDLEGNDAIRLDLRYVENWSLTLDLQILWKTISAVLAKRGAS